MSANNIGMTGMTDADRLLPSPAILKAIAEKYPQAPAQIFARSQELQRLAHEKQNRAQEERERMQAVRAKTGRGLGARITGLLYACPALKLSYDRAAPARNENHNWAIVGNYMREAIGGFLCENPAALSHVLATVSEAQWHTMQWQPASAGTAAKVKKTILENGL